MSPSKDFYIECVASSEKTPAMDAAAKVTAFNKAFQQFKTWVAAIWGIDAIKDGETTSADNESSIVLYVKPEGNKPFLFTGDAGCDALTRALDYGEAIEMPLADCHFVQMPHHGGRHNVGPTVLNRLLGDNVEKDSSPTKVSFVSVGKNSDHPRKCVVNAFITRGCTVYVCSTNTLCHHEGEVPPRNWGSATPEKFSTQVEE